MPWIDPPGGPPAPGAAGPEVVYYGEPVEIAKYQLNGTVAFSALDGISVVEPTQQTTLQLLPLLTPLNQPAFTPGVTKLPGSLGGPGTAVRAIYAGAGGPDDVALTGLTTTIMERTLDSPV